MAKFLFYDDTVINLMLQDEKLSGGAAVQTYAWIRGLMEEGQDVYVMTNTAPVRHNKNLLKEECRNIKLVPTYDPGKGVRWLRWLYYRLPYIYKTLRAVKPDYLYVSIPAWTSALLGIVCRLLKIKFIQRISNDNQLDKRFLQKHAAIHQFFLFLGLRLSHHILCQNNYQLQLITKKFPGKSALKISNPLYIKDQEPVSALRSERCIAWLGNFRYTKNLKLLYEIACTLKREQFLIAGKEGPKCDDETRYYVEKLKQLPNVQFCGFLQRTQVLPFLANAHFLLNTSLHEGFSNTFLEAWSIGIPVISGVNVNPDSIISKYDLGIIYNDVFDLCTQYSVITPDRYQQMSDNAREYVENHHGYRLLAGRLLSYLSQTGEKISKSDSRWLPLTDQTTQG